MAPNRNLINSGKSLGQIELNIEHIELENLEKAKKKVNNNYRFLGGFLEEMG